jgi:hypothetical protein
MFVLCALVLGGLQDLGDEGANHLAYWLFGASICLAWAASWLLSRFSFFQPTPINGHNWIQRSLASLIRCLVAPALICIAFTLGTASDRGFFLRLCLFLWMASFVAELAGALFPNFSILRRAPVNGRNWIRQLLGSFVRSFPVVGLIFGACLLVPGVDTPSSFLFLRLGVLIWLAVSLVEFGVSALRSRVKPAELRETN